MEAVISDAERSRRPTREEMAVPPPANEKQTPEKPYVVKYVDNGRWKNQPSVRVANKIIGDPTPQDEKDEAFLSAVAKADTGNRCSVSNPVPWYTPALRGL